MIAVLFDFIHPCHVEGKNVFLCDYNIRRKTTVKVNHVSPLIMGMDMFFCLRILHLIHRSQQLHAWKMAQKLQILKHVFSNDWGFHLKVYEIKNNPMWFSIVV